MSVNCLSIQEVNWIRSTFRAKSRLYHSRFVIRPTGTYIFRK